MEKVKVVKIFDVRTGVSRSSGKEWKSRDVLLESVQSVMYPEKWMANLFGDAVEKFTAKEGDIISVAFASRCEREKRTMLQRGAHRGVWK